jgi:SET domain-containing protein
MYIFQQQVVEDKHIVIMAKRDILEDEEIVYDYKFPVEEKKLKCYCGASKCLGSMN